MDTKFSNHNVPQEVVPNSIQDYLRYYFSWVHHCSKLVSESVASNFPRLYVATNRPGNYKSYKAVNVSKSTVKISKRKYFGSDNFMEILDHPLLDLLYKPNGYHSYFEFFSLIQLHLGLNGNAYILKANSQLHLLSPSSVSLERGELVEQPIKNYIYKVGDKSHKLLSQSKSYILETVIHLIYTVLVLLIFSVSH